MQIEHRALEYWARFQLENTEEILFDLQTELMTSGRDLFFLRLASPENITIFMEIPGEWEIFDFTPLYNNAANSSRDFIVLKSKEMGYSLEIKTLLLDSGHLLQIGASTEERFSLQLIFLRVFSTVFIFLILISFASGVYLSSRSLQPIRKLNSAITSIIKTGNMSARIPESGTGDELNDLVVSFNTMLGRIDQLISGMRHTLDNVAHDLKTPMTRFRGVAELALSGKGNPESYKEALSEGLVQSEHILSMLNAILDIAAAESGLMKLNTEKVNLKDIILEVLEPYQYIADEKQVYIEKKLADTTVIECDPGKIRQAAGNLVDNAIKYTGEGGCVSVQTFRNDSGRVCLRIADSGPGIEPDDLPYIWDRLYRSRKIADKPGLGLGLSIVKAIVEAHGGTIAAESTPGRGSTFTICV